MVAGVQGEVHSLHTERESPLTSIEVPFVCAGKILVPAEMERPEIADLLFGLQGG